MTKKIKEKIKVGFTKNQHQRVHEFLEFMRTSGMVEKDLGTPIKITVDWGYQNDAGFPHVLFKGPHDLQKVIPIKDIIEADDAEIPAVALRVIPGGKVSEGEANGDS